MQSIIDGLFAVIILFFAVSVGVSFLYPLFSVPSTEAKEHQLDDVAIATFTSILSSPGLPEDWGTNLNVNASNLQAFGLAKSDSSIPYTLDINKILRITNSSNFPMPSTVYIDPETVAKLLGLRGENRYEFSITITPALNISVNVLGYSSPKNNNSIIVPTVFSLSIKNYAGKPASNANVTVTYVLISVKSQGNKEISFYNVTSITTLTDWKGDATLDASSWFSSITSNINNLKHLSLTVLITAWYNGIRSAYVYNTETNLLYASTFGNYLTLLYPTELTPPGAFQINNLTLGFVPPIYVYSDYLHNETNGNSGLIINKGSKKYRVYQLGNIVEEDVALLLVPAQYRGNYYDIVAFRIPYVMNFSTGKPGGSIKTVVLKSLVKIGSYDYLFKLTMWRSAEY